MKVEDIEEQVRAAQLQQRWRKLDLLLGSIGSEIADLFVIALALTILCAPIAFGIGATWAAAYFAGAASGMTWLGWVAGAGVFVFFLPLYLGSRLQRASRRAVAALIAGK